MSNRQLLGRSPAALTFALLAALFLVGVAGAAKPGKSARPGKTVAPGAVVGETRAPNVVNSQTIYDDGDATSDLYFSPPPTTTGFQDFWFLVRGDIVSTTPPPPFDIETVSYYLRQVWNSSAGTVGVWSAGNLVTPFFVGDDDSITVGFNNVVLSTPLTIPAVGTGVFWLGAWHSYSVGSTAVECTTCRTVGLDDTGNNLPTAGYFISAEGPNLNITGATPFGLNRVPIIRAGITATANTVPVELLEFRVD